MHFTLLVNRLWAPLQRTEPLGLVLSVVWGLLFEEQFLFAKSGRPAALSGEFGLESMQSPRAGRLSPGTPSSVAPSPHSPLLAWP